MSQTASHPFPPSRRATTTTLWMIQALLALLFLFAGSMKLMMPAEVLMAQLPLPLSAWFVHFIGICEVAGALGLILPGLTHIRQELTSLAACGLAIVMVGATGYTLLGHGGAGALFPLVVGLLAASVAYGRRAFATVD